MDLLFFTFKKGNVFSAYGREGVKMNFIDRIFVGELTSTVMCEECENVGILEFGLMWNRSHTGFITLSQKYKIVLPILYLFVCKNKTLLKVSHLK